MPLQFINIKDSSVTFADENKNPEKRIEVAETDLATLVFQSMQDKLKISQLEMELGNALIEIIIMKMGGNE